MLITAGAVRPTEKVGFFDGTLNCLVVKIISLKKFPIASDMFNG